MKKSAIFLFFLQLFIPAIVHSYPNGTPMYVTDATPFCASCHSAAKAEYIPELPADFAKNETAEFLYGTENTEKAGFFQRPSGRILFSDELNVQVE